MHRLVAATVEAMKAAVRDRQKESRTILITILRWNISILLFTTIFCPDAYQPFLDWLWNLLRQLRVYQWSTFETLWTVFWYGAIEDLITVAYISYPEWRLAHRDKSYEEIKQNPPRKPKGMRRPSRRGREALIYIAPLLAMDLLMIKKFADVPLTDMLESGNYDLDSLSSIGTHKSTFLVPSLHNFTLSSPLQTKRALPPDAPSSRRVAIELILSFALYDALFFLFHLALHIAPGLRNWHHSHHAHAEMQPQITNQLSIFERLGLVLLANFSLNVIGSHVLTRTLFIPIFVWLLVEIHTGLDLPWAYERILPQGWGGGARKHAAHHRDGSGGFEPYFNWLDASWEAFCQFTTDR
jgi:cholesterol 25-hydroxylase